MVDHTALSLEMTFTICDVLYKCYVISKRICKIAAVFYAISNTCIEIF